MKGYVYLICNPVEDTYKIGRSKDVQKRLKQIQTGCSAELFVIRAHETNYPVQLEQMLHVRFRNKRQLNEWFKLDGNDIAGFEETCKKTDEIIKAMNTEEPMW